MFYRLYFNSVEEAQEFIDRMNGLGYDWHPEHVDEQLQPCLQFECSKVNYEDVRKAYMGE